jgi:hypothetical protein
MTCSDASCVSSRCKSCRWSRPVATVVISSGAKGDRRVGSLDVKVSLGEASKSAGRSNGEPVSPEIPAWSKAERLSSARRPCRRRELGQQRRNHRGRRGRHVDKESTAKARNHSRVAKAFPHSEGSAYKPRAVKSRCACEWGGWGRQARMLGTEQPERSEGPWGRATGVARTAVCDRTQPFATEPRDAGSRGTRRMNANRVTRRVCREQA